MSFIMRFFAFLMIFFVVKRVLNKILPVGSSKKMKSKNDDIIEAEYREL